MVNGALIMMGSIESFPCLKCGAPKPKTERCKPCKSAQNKKDYERINSRDFKLDEKVGHLSARAWV